MSLNWSSSLGTLTRKLRKSLAQRGVIATAKRFITKPIEFTTACLRDMSPAHRRCRAAENDFDRSMQVETCAHTDPGWMARITSDNWVYGIGYAPVPIPTARAILAGLNIDYKKYVFVDFGAGKGRMLFLSSELPFQRIIGVEYSPDLYGILQRNLARYQNPAQQCFKLECLLQDAVDFQLPDEPLILFFHHPFEEAIFKQVINRIERSLRQKPRDIRVIYYDSICGALFEQNPWFYPIERGARDPSLRFSSPWTVYGTRNGLNGACHNSSATGWETPNETLQQAGHGAGI